MCLSVYTGSNTPLTEPQDLCDGGLGLEPAKWHPAPLESYAHIYLLGARQTGGPLACTCLLSEHVDWSLDPPSIVSDPQTDGADDPFDQLKTYITLALDQPPHAGMVCDDFGGVEHDATAEDYEPVVLSPSLIRAGAMIFSDDISPFAMRRFSVVHDAQA